MQTNRIYITIKISFFGINYFTNRKPACHEYFSVYEYIWSYWHTRRSLLLDVFFHKRLSLIYVHLDLFMSKYLGYVTGLFYILYFYILHFSMLNAIELLRIKSSYNFYWNYISEKTFLYNMKYNYGIT